MDSYNGNWTTAAAGLTAELAKRQAVEALWRSTAANGAARSVFSSDITSFPSPIMNGSAAVKVSSMHLDLWGLQYELSKLWIA